MSLKAVDLRADAEPSLPKSPMISIGSHNDCSIVSPNRIQNDLGMLGAFTSDVRASIVARFWAKVNKTDGCWLWTGSVTGSGSVHHAQFVLPRTPDGKQAHVYAHRLAWELTYGPIPDGFQVNHQDHCSAAHCVRADDHLYLGR